jgi:AsmA protein
MRRVLRITLIVIGVLVVLLAVAPFVIPVDAFRPTIEEKASAALGRSVHLGRLSLSLFSGSLSAEDLAIGDDPAFSESPFLTAKSLKVGVEILPLLFSRTLNVTGVTIDAPEVTLLRTPAGQWNFASLARLGGKSDATQTQAAPDVSIKKIELVNGRIVVARKGSEKRSTYDHVAISASDVSMASAFPVTLSADLPSGGKLTLDGRAGPLDRRDASLTPMSAKLVVKSLNLATTGFLDSSAGLGGLVDLDSAFESQGGEAAVKGTATLSKALLVAGGSPAGVPVTVTFDTKYNLRSSVGVLNPSVLAIGKAAARLSGTYNTVAETTLVQVRMRAADMPASDLQAFLPALNLTLPRGSSLQAGTLSTDLQIAGPVNKLIISGNIGVLSAKLAGFDLGSKMATVAQLAGVKTGRDLDIEKLTTELRVAPNGVEATNFVLVVPGLGTLTGAGTVDARNQLDFKMVALLTAATGTAGPATSPAAGPAAAQATSPAPNQAQPASGGLASLGGLASRLGLGDKLAGVSDKAGTVGNLARKYAGATCKGGMTVPFQVKGTTADPKFVPDVGGLAAATLKSKLGCL